MAFSFGNPGAGALAGGAPSVQSGADLGDIQTEVGRLRPDSCIRANADLLARPSGF